MAQIEFQSLLNAASVPAAAAFAHRTVLIPQLDQNLKTPQAFFGDMASANFGVPQLIYAENVMPTEEGITSTAVRQLIAPVAPATDLFDQAIQLRDADENVVYLAPAEGRNYIFRNEAEGWTTAGTIAGVAGLPVSRAYVNGRTFICYAGAGVYEYNPTTNAMEKKTLIGVTDAEVLGIGQSNNYMLYHSKIEVRWSSLVDPLDVTPSLQTGAGRATPQDVKGPITALIGVPGGFIICTTRNAVGATYSTNVRQPFIFREIDNAGGLESYEQVSVETTSSRLYAWTTGGLQSWTLKGAEAIDPGVTDFLAGKFWEEWDAVNKIFRRARQSANFKVKVTFVSSRYLVISYGRPNQGYEYAMIFDSDLKRWGRVKVQHVDATFFTYLPTGASSTYTSVGADDETYDTNSDGTYLGARGRAAVESTAKDSLAFLQKDGTMLQLVLDRRERSSNAIAVFGRYQLRRGKSVTLQTVSLNNVDESWPLRVSAIPTYDGHTEQPFTVLQEIERAGTARKYGSSVTGTNISIAIEGTFELADLILALTAHGR